MLDGKRVRTLGGEFPDVQVVPGALATVHHLDRFPDGTVLLSGDHTVLLEPERPDRLPLGEGINHLQVDAQGRIWAGYCDQNMRGLICFDRSGAVLRSHDGCPTDFSGPRWLAVDGDRVLFGARYDDAPERTWLSTLGRDRLSTPVPVDLLGPDWRLANIAGRGPFAHVLAKGRWWRAHVGDVAG